MINIIDWIKKLFGSTDENYHRHPRSRLPYHNSRHSTRSDSYILEYRYSGYPKDYFLDRYFELKRKYNLNHPLYKYVPHMTLIGPVSTASEKQLINEITQVIFDNSKYFHLPGNLVSTGKFIEFKTPDNCRVLAVEIIPPPILKKIKSKIEQNLQKTNHSKCTIYDDEIWHTTVWKTRKNSSTDHALFDRIWTHLRNHPPQEMKFILDRVTLVKNAKILLEFDLVNNITLNRIESLDSTRRYHSYVQIKKELEHKGEHFKFSSAR